MIRNQNIMKLKRLKTYYVYDLNSFDKSDVYHFKKCKSYSKLELYNALGTIVVNPEIYTHKKFKKLLPAWEKLGLTISIT